jgi:hypothetical protein
MAQASWARVAIRAGKAVVQPLDSTGSTRRGSYRPTVAVGVTIRSLGGQTDGAASSNW